MSRKFLFLFLVTFILLLSGCFSPYEYSPGGKDTTEIFGNGEYQMSRNQRGTELLSNQKFNIVAIHSITAWEQHGNKAYFVGTDSNIPTEGVRMYGVLEIDKNLLQLFWNDELDSGYILANVTLLCEEGSATILFSSSDFLQEDWEILLKLESEA